MSEVKKVPKIRFAGFAEPWEQRKLSAIADKVTEKNTDLAIQETFTNSAEFGIISQRDFFDHDISNAENINGYYVVRSEDFVYNPRISTSAPVGPVNRNKLGRNGVMSPLYTVFRTHDIDTTYLEWFFKSSYWHPFMFFNGDSGARSDRFSIKDAIFFEMPIPVPSLAEQREIGAYMNKLDNLIILHQRKLDRLVVLKQAMLEKMFPQNGSNVPEIRFAGFTGSWEQRKLGNICIEMLAGGDIDKEKIVEQGKYPVIANALTNDGIVGFYEHDYRVKAPAVTITGRGDVGHAKARKIDFTPVVRLLAIRTNHDVDFIENAINTLKVMVESTGVPQLTVPQLEKSELFLPPTIAEEQIIGAYLRQLDNLITLHQRKHESLKRVKAALLQKMFV